MELIKISVGRSNSHLITSALLLLAAAFFSLAAARPPLSTATTDHHPAAVDFSVLKLPTEAASSTTAIEVEEKEELCCDNCGPCSDHDPLFCFCFDEVKKCPSWCGNCIDSGIGYKRCMFPIKNYCSKPCNRY